MSQIFDKLLTSEQDNVVKSPKYHLPLKRIDFADDKDYTKFIKNVERLVRASIEYKEFIQFARETLNATVCAFTGWTFDETSDIEIHHYPLTLFDICQAVIEDWMSKGQEFSTFDVALEVIKLHFNLKIGIVPLSGTLHKAFHNGAVKIPIEFVIGDFNYITDNLVIPQELVDKVDNAKTITMNSEEYFPMWQKFGLENFRAKKSALDIAAETQESKPPTDLNIPKLG